PMVKASGCTGSTQGGKAIFGAASSRPEPIPVYAEMGRTNPVFVLPGAIKAHAASIAKGLVSSVTLGTGQFCTNPGLVVTMDSPETDAFVATAAAALEATAAGTMLTPAIQQAYNEGINRIQQVDGVTRIAGGTAGGAPCEGVAYLLQTTAGTVLRNPSLAEEVFGPSSLLVTAANSAQLYELAGRLEGHLTATIHATPDDLKEHAGLAKI